ncbi:unnamed protein product [Schistosoma turkestanicum]|nr:unnamed protein product [Schistosoma turkestanicum]
MEIKMKLKMLIFLSFVTTISTQREEKFKDSNEKTTVLGEKTRNTQDRIHGHEKEINTNGKMGRNGRIGARISTGGIKSKYRRRKTSDLLAKGKFRSRGIKTYGVVSSEYEHFLIEEKLDKYGRAKPVRSKFKNRGKQKKYSKKIADNRFLIKGGLIQEKKHKKYGLYHANGSHVTLSLQLENNRGSNNRSSEGSARHNDKQENNTAIAKTSESRSQRHAVSAK